MLALGQQTFPTTISASSPDKHTQKIDELFRRPAAAAGK
jgi:hypothetical protein